MKKGEKYSSTAAIGLEEGPVDGVRLREGSTIANPATKTWLHCEDTFFSVKDISILKGVNLTLPPGRLVALMGPSGAGKTSLLNVLGARGKGKVAGSVTLNGKPITRMLAKQECKLVPQHDDMIPILTAKQMLMYTAELSLDLPKEELEERVDDIMQSLSLEDCANVYCGGPDLKGLSGGQMKRVSIAMELLSNPSCLMLDEPTSGLDSRVAQDVVGIIRSLTRTGRTVVCTIHQPSFNVFSMFDWLVMMDKGKVVYNGEVDKLSGYLETIGSPAPSFTNPVDHFMTVLNLPVPDETCEGYQELFEKSELGEEARRIMEQDTQDMKDYLAKVPEQNKLATKKGVSEKSWGSQFTTLFRRQAYVTMKDKKQARMRLIQVLFVGIIIGTIYFQMPFAQDRVQDRISILFLMILFFAMSSIMSTALAIPFEKTVLLREYNNGYYAKSAWFLARLGVLLIFQAVFAVIFASFTYYMVGLAPEFYRFCIFMACYLLVALMSGAFGFAAGIAFPTPQAASAIVPMMVMPMSIFSGLFIPLSNIPSYWVWVYYLSFFQYAISTCVINEFEGRYLVPCTAEDLETPGQCPYGACITNITDPQPQPCPGEIVLNSFSYDENDVGLNFGILVAFLVFSVLLGLFNFDRFLKKHR